MKDLILFLFKKVLSLVVFAFSIVITINLWIVPDSDAWKCFIPIVLLCLAISNFLNEEKDEGV